MCVFWVTCTQIIYVQLMLCFIPHLNLPPFSALFLAGDIVQLKLPMSMKDLKFYNCSRLTGTCKAPIKMSEGQYNRLCDHCPSFLTLSFFLLSSYLLPHCSILIFVGDLAQLQLPVGMQQLDVGGCRKITGKRELVKITINSINCFAVVIQHPHSSHPSD